MRRILLAFLSTALSVGFSQAAFTADIGGKDAYASARRPVPVAAYNWTGLYVGADVGYQLSSVDTFVPAAPGLGTADGRPNSISLGGHIGYRYQFPNRFVIGVEGDIAWLDGDHTAALFGLPGVGFNARTHWDASVRGTMGFAFDRTLIYATGGASWINGEGCGVILPAPTTCLAGTTYSRTFSGWVVGGGGAFAFPGNLTARIEYLHADYGTTSVPTPVAAGGTTNVRITTNKVRAGLSWRFIGP